MTTGAGGVGHGPRGAAFALRVPRQLHHAADERGVRIECRALPGRGAEHLRKGGRGGQGHRRHPFSALVPQHRERQRKQREQPFFFLIDTREREKLFFEV